jgi:TetR/AcrR family transcriptional regulator, transcriptional repressor for nem operon
LGDTLNSTSQHKNVGRPREFEEDRVLDAVMNIFWNQGYEGTSLKDLCSVTGLHKGSLYQAFGDKHQLFLTSLKYYMEQSFKEVAASAYLHDSPMANLRSLLNEITTKCIEGEGCMELNSLVEMAPHDQEVKQMIDHSYAMKQRFLTDLIDRAQRDGEITIKQEPDRLAAVLMVTLAGLAATVKGFSNTDHISYVLEDVLSSWA